jgi:ribosomal protein S18 acetylase RimI-like enzyme
VTGRTTARVALRPALPADREFLLGVYESTRTEEVALTAWDDAQKRAFLRQQAEAQDTDYRGRYGDAGFLVVERDGEPIGRLYRGEKPGELLLLDIALLPQWRGQGIGSALIDDLLAEADRRGMTVTLHVEHWNPAKRLYDRLGFAVMAEDGVYARLERPPRPV